MEEVTRAWEQALWAELEAAEGPEQMILANEAITRMTQVLATQLADYRRAVAVDLIENQGYTYPRLADAIGIREAVARRLVSEGRAVRLARHRRELESTAPAEIAA